MFPVRFNSPFRKKDGSMTTIGAEISEGGGGGGYTLPTASETTKGGIKIGAGLSMDGETLNNTNPTPATPYNLPTASADTLGGVKVGDGLSINENGVLSANGGGGSSIHTTSYISSATASVNAKSTAKLSLDVPELRGKTILGVNADTAGVGACLGSWYSSSSTLFVDVIFINSTDSNHTGVKARFTYAD